MRGNQSNKVVGRTAEQWAVIKQTEAADSLKVLLSVFAVTAKDNNRNTKESNISKYFLTGSFYVGYLFCANSEVTDVLVYHRPLSGLLWSSSSHGNKPVIVTAGQVYDELQLPSSFLSLCVSWLMFLLEVFQTDGSTGCLWSHAVSRFSPLKIIINHSATCPIYIEVQVVCVQVYSSTSVFDGDALYVYLLFMSVFND